MPAFAATFNYSTSGPTPIPDGAGANSCGIAAVVSINVSDSFLIGDLNVGLIVSHTFKEDLLISLESPNGTNVTLVNREGGGFENYNIRLDDQETTNIQDIDHVTTAPYPEYSRQPLSPLSAFDGENASGTWTLSIQDCWDADVGSFQELYLEFTDQAPVDPLIVTSTADTNTIGTLRFAINHANSNQADDDITFDIPGLGPHVIAPTLPLPTVSDDGISIDGSTQGNVVCDGTPNATGGMSNRKHYIVLFGSNHTDNTLNISNAENVTIKGLTIGNSDENGLEANNADGLTLLCNHFGASTDTTGDVRNLKNGVEILSSDNVVIGDGTLSGANIVGFNGVYGIFLDSGSNDATIKRNFIGIDATGNSDIGNISDGLIISGGSDNSIIGDQSGGGNVISGNGSDGLDLQGVSGSTILGNYIGSNGIGTTLIANDDDGVSLSSADLVTIGNGTSAGQNVIVGSVDVGILFSNSTGEVSGNLIGLGSGNQSIGNRVGIRVAGTSTAQIFSNNIANNQDDGIELNGSGANAAIYENAIFNNGELGIDLDGDEVTNNDLTPGDSDSGPNDLLNFPEINTIGGNGTTIVDYDIALDVPANTPGYRIEFFKNSAADPSGHGEGEVYLGAVDVTGTGTHTGNFTAAVTVSIGDIMSATTTRKTAASTYDITSEFSGTSAAVATTTSPLVVTNTNDSGAGSLRAAMTYANSNTAEDAISFNIPGAGPHVIRPTSVLPTLTDPGIRLDGETQPGASCGQLTTGTQHDLRIQIDGTNAGAVVQGVEVTASDVTVRGLSVTNFDSYGVGVRNGGDNFTGECLHVGVAPDGITKGPNSKASSRTPGIRLASVANGTVRNSVISGNDDDVLDKGLRFKSVTGGLIEGNIVGLNAAGSASLGNGNDGIFLDDSTSGITIGGTTAAARNILSGNGENGISIGGTVSNITILGNYIGLDRDGVAVIANGGSGVLAASVSTLTIGNGVNSGRNLISGNTVDGVRLTGTVTGLDINDNIIGLAADGSTLRGNGGGGVHFVNNTSIVSDGAQIRNNVITGNDSYEIYVHDAVTNLNIIDNMIGMDATGATILSDGGGGIYGEFTSGWNLNGNIIGSLFGAGVNLNNGTATLQGNTIDTDLSGSSALKMDGGGPYTIGGTGAGEGNIIAGGAGGFSTILVLFGASANIVGNIIRDSGQNGIQLFGSGSSAIIHSNTITNSDRGGDFASGIEVDTGTTAAIYANSISGSGTIGINLVGGVEDANGVTANDSGDADTGPNDLLNFPIVNDILVDGTTSVNYDVMLDVPANAPGYRIDFFKNSSADPSGHGEGEVFLGAIDVTGTGTHTGNFTAAVTVDIGDIISTTTTRKTGALTYDITSEFSANETAISSNPASLAVTKTVSNLLTGDYAIPGSDMIYTFSVVNEGGGSVSSDSIVLIDAMPDQVHFFNGDYDGPGPSTAVIGFEETGTSLTFDPAVDALYSDATTKPSDMSECDYTPTSGYDSNVSYICFNPKGEMLGGDPDPSFVIRFRARIQ